MTKNWALINKKSITVGAGVNTKSGTYPVSVTGNPFRKFDNRSSARIFKRTLRTANNYAIVNLGASMVAR